MVYLHAQPCRNTLRRTPGRKRLAKWEPITSEQGSERSGGPFVIEVQNLQKQYGDLMAVQDVSFTAQSGKIFGLLGPNGAGKSTTIGCISGLLDPSAGGWSLGSRRCLKSAARAQLGVVPQELALTRICRRRKTARWGSVMASRAPSVPASSRNAGRHRPARPRPGTRQAI